MLVTFNNCNGENPPNQTLDSLKNLHVVRNYCKANNYSACIKTESYSVQVLANGMMYLEGEGDLYINLTKYGIESLT